MRRLDLTPALIVMVTLTLLASCSEDMGSVGANRRPETRLFLDTVGAVQSSNLHVRWFGDDPDGIVVGYVFSWDGRSWNFTRRQDSVFVLSLRNNDSTYDFRVAAVDNSAWLYPREGDQLAFTDANGNGIKDPDEEFQNLAGAVDISPARLGFPVVNTPPRVYFGPDTTQESARRVALPDTTFTVVSFEFNGRDIDGDNSIAGYEWSLNDSSQSAPWKRVGPGTTFLTLFEKDGLIGDSDNRFFVRAVDNGGVRSSILRYPQDGRVWFVRKPKGGILVVKDGSAGGSDIDNFYRNAINDIDAGRLSSIVDFLDIERAPVSGRIPTLPAFLNPTFSETLKLFKAVLWYADKVPNLTIAQSVIPQYLSSGGRMLFVTDLPPIISADSQTYWVDFAPVDSISTLEMVDNPFALRNGDSIPPLGVASNRYPALVKERGSVFLHGLYPKITATTLYRLPESSSWKGSPTLGVLSADRRMVFLHLPLHQFNGRGTAFRFIRQVFVEEFGL